MHAAVHLVVNIGFHDPVTASLKALYWLPITYCIKYKLCLMMHVAVNGLSPEYIIETARTNFIFTRPCMTVIMVIINVEYL